MVSAYSGDYDTEGHGISGWACDFKFEKSRFELLVSLPNLTSIGGI